jgi:hypothetical protein
MVAEVSCSSDTPMWAKQIASLHRYSCQLASMHVSKGRSAVEFSKHCMLMGAASLVKFSWLPFRV